MKTLRHIRERLSYLAVILVISVYFLQIMNVRYWKTGHGVIFWDTLSYYAYLPATFIYHDLSLKFIDKDARYFSDKIWPVRLPNKNYVIKTSMGLSILYSPFFFAAHVYALHSDKYPADGYSLPYHVALEFSSLFYLIFGLLVLRKILVRYFTETIAALTILATGLATNLFSYTTQAATMPHSFEFTLIVLFLWCTIRWYEKRSWPTSVYLGLLTGLISLIRPTDLVIVLVFLLYDIRSPKERLREFWDKKWHIAVMILLSFLVWLPQFLYWESVSGKWLLFSYGSKERFFWMQPEILKVLIGFRKGWLIYTPVMIFGMAGLFMLKNKVKEWTLAFPVTIILSIYIISSWWCWWYGGGFGMRPMIDFYGMMAVGMAAFITAITKRQRMIRGAFFILFSLTSVLGIYHHIQSYYGAIHWDSMTWEAYRHSFGKIAHYPGMEKYLDHPDYEKAKIKRN